MGALLVLLGGRPGSGKSSLAQALADACGLEVVRTDEVRKELAGVAADEVLPAHSYTLEASAANYAEVMARGRRALREGRGVILDGTWSKVKEREMGRSLAAEVGAQLVELMCVAPLNVLEERLNGRTRTGAFGSDADARVMRMRPFEEWPEAVTVETAWASPEELTAGIAQRLGLGREATGVEDPGI